MSMYVLCMYTYKTMLKTKKERGDKLDVYMKIIGGETV